MVDFDIGYFSNLIIFITSGDPFSLGNEVPILNCFFYKHSNSYLYSSGAC